MAHFDHIRCYYRYKLMNWNGFRSDYYLFDAHWRDVRADYGM